MKLNFEIKVIVIILLIKCVLPTNCYYKYLKYISNNMILIILDQC